MTGVGPPQFEIRARRGHPDFLDLPWATRLEHWDTPRLVKMAHGVSRHIVRFVAYDDRVYALKATEERIARREYDLLRSLAESKLPVVEGVGVVTRREGDGGELPAVLITRYLDFSLPYRYLFGNPAGADLRPRLLDAGVILLARLHLDGFFWGDCSLNNILFRRDAGALMAYLVDAETGEHRPSISDAMREHDVEIACFNIAGDLSDLIESGRIPPLDIDEVVTEMVDRYETLWTELTHSEEFPAGDRHRIEARIRRLEDLGFDVEEVAISAAEGGRTLRMRPAVLEEGHHARELERLTGLSVQENQARRFLTDIHSWQAHLGQVEGAPIPLAVAAARWLTEVYQPRIDAIPAGLADRLEPAELFHELLEHRWFLSEEAGHQIHTDEALDDYLANVLDRRPAERIIIDEI